MLCQFSVKNFKSIKQQVTFDMQTAQISEHENQVLKCKDGESFLPVAVLYGPNGGGKTNVLQAMFSLCALVLKAKYSIQGNHEDRDNVNRNSIVPFLFSEDSQQQATEFEIFFRTQKSEYRYILHVKNNNVVYESLDRIKFETKRKSSLFEKKDKIVLKGELAHLKVSDDLSEDIPLLSYLGLTYKKNEVINDVMKWFESQMVFINYGNPSREAILFVNKSKEYKRLIVDMIKELDLDIEDFRVEEIDGKINEIYTTHIIEGYSQEISLKDESSGTKKIFGLLPFIITSLMHGRTLIVDELDAKVHPMLLKYIIELYTNMSINKNQSQLIFTSHDLSTLNGDIFRRDEIWFVAKGNEQNSVLYSLVEFKDEDGKSVRKDARFDKQYLEGKYGADPYLKKIIDWSYLDGQ
ncbi:MAG: ATP-binding protein [Coprobacillus sp.]